MKYIPRTNGFSTLEILIAMAVLLIAISSTLLLSGGSQSVSVDAQSDSEALTVAEKTLESEQALGREDFRLVNPTTTVEVVNGTPYTKQVSIPSQPDFFTKNVQATVSWPGTYGRSPSVSLSTLVTNFQSATGGDTCSSVLTGNWAAPSQNNLLFGGISGINDPGGTYAITGIDAYQKRLYLTVNSPGTAPTAQSITSGTQADTAISGGVAWSNPGNARTIDGSNATSASSLNSTKVTDYLKLTGFGFSVPSWATITGIKVEVQKSRGSSGSGSIVDSQIKIVKNGVIGGLSNTNKADTSTSWPSVNTYVTSGTDLWGESWTPADINSGTFGVAISATGSSGGSRIAQIDNVRITVTYTRQLYVLSLANPASPTYLGSLGSDPITTGLNAIAVATSSAGNYAYVATNSGSASGQLEIFDVTNANPVATSTFIVPGVTGTGSQAVGNSIFYKDGYVYLGLTKTATGPEFNIIDVHDVGVHFPPTLGLVGSYPVGSVVNAIYVKDGYVYLAHPTGNSPTEQFTIVNISDPTHPVRVGGSFNPGGIGGNGKNLYLVGTTFYGARTASNISGAADSIPELYAFNINNANPAAVATSSLGTLALSASGDSINGFIARDYLAFLLTNSQVQIKKILQGSSWTFPQYASPITLPNSGAGVALDCEGNYIYAASVPSSGAYANMGSITAVTAL